MNVCVTVIHSPVLSDARTRLPCLMDAFATRMHHWFANFGPVKSPALTDRRRGWVNERRRT